MLLFEVLVCTITIVLGFIIPKFSGLSDLNVKRLRLLWIVHIVFGVAYYIFYMSQGGSDGLKYWNGAKRLAGSDALRMIYEAKGTRAMYAINYIPSNIFDLSFFTGTILYALIGFIGLLFFCRIFIKYIPYNVKVFGFPLFPTVLYLPNLHFWSSGVGKDTLLFFCIGIFSWAVLNINKRILLAVFAVFLGYIVRPHIALFMLLGFSMAYLANESIPKYRRVILFIMLLAGGIAMLPSVMEYTKVEELSVEGYEAFSDRQVSNLSRAHTTSSVDISSYPLPLKIFTFLYRPTFIDINGVAAILAAFENLGLLLLSIVVLKRKPVETFRNAPFVVKGLVIFLFLGTIGYSLSLGNLGIMLRMRNMFLPGMLLFICWSYSYHYQTKTAPLRALVKT